MSIFRDTIWQQILDGKRTWTANDTGGDLDRFHVEVVQPLEHFQSLGWLRFVPHEGAYRGRKRVDSVRIDGEVRTDE
jgi:hypothetical protein